MEWMSRKNVGVTQVHFDVCSQQHLRCLFK